MRQPLLTGEDIQRTQRERVLISDKFRTIFVHIPKCGGSSIEASIFSEDEKTEDNLWMGFLDRYHNKFQTGGLQHLKCLQIRQQIGRSKFNDYFKFSVVRNPYARMVSQFLYMRRRPDLRDFVGMNIDDNFLAYLSKIQKRSHVQWESQVSFLYDFKGACLVDLLVRLEEINTLPAALRERGVPFDVGGVPKINAHALNYNYNDYYCSESKSIVADLFQEDLDAFRYDSQTGVPLGGALPQ